MGGAAGTSPEGGAASPSRQAALRFLLGGCSGALAKTLVAPLDRAKIQFQISRRAFSYAGLAAELARTVREEGARGLFRGNLAQVARVLPYSGSQLMCFDVFSSALLARRRAAQQGAEAAAGGGGGGGGASAASQLGALDRMLAGAGAGAVSVALTYPLDVLRARLAVAQELPGGAPRPMAGLWAALRDMHRAGGLRSLYRGLVPTLAGIVPYAGISFAVYEALKDRLRGAAAAAAAAARVGSAGSGGSGRAAAFSIEPSTLERLLCGGIAGFAGQAAAYPLDIVRRAWLRRRARVRGACGKGGARQLRTALSPPHPLSSTATHTSPPLPRASPPCAPTGRMQTDGYSPLHAHLQPLPALAPGAPAAPASFLRRALLGLRRGQGGTVDVLLRVVDTEGVRRGLFKGLSMNALKGPLAVGVSFCTYDALKGALGVEGGGGGGGHG